MAVETQEALKLAACIGNRFELQTLAVVCQKPEEDVAADIWGALQEGLLLPISETYKFFQGSSIIKEPETYAITVSYRFLHDRVQQAAYSLIPENQKQQTHFQIGKLLLKNIPAAEREENIFEIVNQLNYGIRLIGEQKDKDELAQLNLIACQKAKSATAYQAASEYANIGLSLLGENPWQRQYEMSLAFHDLAAELAFLCGEFKTMEHYIQKVIAQAHSLLEQVNVYKIKIQSSASQNKLTETVAIAQQFLQKLKISFPDAPTQKYIEEVIADIDKQIQNRNIEDLVDLPQMSDPKQIAIVQILNSILPTVFFSNPSLFPLLVCTSIKLSIQYGNTPVSAYSYSCYGVIACTMWQNVETGVKFGQLALQVVSKMNAKAVLPDVATALGSMILHRKSHIKETRGILQEGYQTALEIGNLEFAGYNAHIFCINSFWSNQHLPTLKQETSSYCNALAGFNQLTSANYCRIYWQSTLNLLNVTEHPSRLSGEALQEVEFVPQLLEANDLYGLYFFYLSKLMLCYLFGEIEAAQNYVVKIKPYFKVGSGSVGEPVFYFYDSLTALEVFNLPSSDKSEIFQKVEQNQAQLQEYWAKYAPMNHQHKVDLVAAEISRVKGQNLEAMELYDRAIAGAVENEYIQEEALANELAARFYLDCGRNRVAADYMIDAYYCYAQWGAKAKTDHLEKKYPQLLTPILEKREHDNSYNSFTFTQPSNTLTTTNPFLDQASVIKASRTISEEIELDALLSKLMQILIENAGANKAVLLLNNSENWEIVAQCNNNNSCHLSTIPLAQSKTIPSNIINIVKRTQKTVLLNNLEQDNTFTGDPYLIKQPPKSLLCTPILNQGKLIGILYLENHLTTETFTSERVEVLNLLTAQAAISIENARLYQNLEGYSRNLQVQVQQRTQELQENNQHLQQTLQQLQQTQAQLIQTEKMSSLGKIVAGIAHEINNPITFISGNIIYARGYFQELLELLNFYQDNSSASSAAIQEKSQEIDLEFICKDLDKLFLSMETGSDRIRQIILGLRNFSRLDESQRKRVDIHEGLENTLMILQHRLRGNSSSPDIAIVKNYGQLPSVNCYASQLNQVFLYILTNAIDALNASKARRDCPTITIASQMQNQESIRISIADNGPGMSETVQQRIFDPFFTTKPVGQGTGLGLSISYQIVTKQHGGKLQCISQVEKGTKFIIDIPIDISRKEGTGNREQGTGRSNSALLS
ncbi:MAG: GAF domain-containing protein [Okeania sp. SIO3I5]|uniref:trifunctional serine/threonine-protein kinase/ATP-binding protein/sensor histidine kinase n=1 Tax=Okeania sp. SIO3I5 TaxID=2607805 RepID=UPI0013B7C398|nr:ATP-binding protein [Okeania sp. SIO3I5]NEQ41736.1 GAF domain-containing protein [Okeania sp. SIO3I5]